MRAAIAGIFYPPSPPSPGSARAIRVIRSKLLAREIFRGSRYLGATAPDLLWDQENMYLNYRSYPALISAREWPRDRRRA